MEDDFFTIRVNILNTSYPINIKREEEEIYRKAAKQLNNKILDYQKKYYIDHKEEISKRLKKYYKENRFYILNRQHEYLKRVKLV